MSSSMHFDDLLAKAGKNAQKLNRKVNEAEAELDVQKRRQLERIALEKQKERERIKRNAPPPPPKPKVRRLTRSEGVLLGSSLPPLENQSLAWKA